MEDEMHFHIEMLAKEHEANGLSKTEAMRRARIEFGGIVKMKENMREARGVMWIENIVRDSRLALRQMKRSPGFTAVALTTLGVGIGACAAMFSVVNTVLIEPLPFENPENLIWVQNYRTGGLSGQTTRVDNFLDWRDQNESFDSMGAYFPFSDFFSYILSDESGEGFERFNGIAITEGFLETLGVKPMLGRNFSPNEFLEPVGDGTKAAILSYSYWMKRFSGDQTVVGSTITINKFPTEVIGVMPKTFDFDSVFTPGSEVHMLTPFPLIDQTTNWGNTLAIVGRLKSGVSLNLAQAELEVITERIRDENPNTNRFYHEVHTEMLDDRVRGSFRVSFYVLSGAVACVLAIACVNLSNLLIARANVRRKEFAMRAAIGAKRSHLIRQTLTESLILALGGCLAGVPLAYLAVLSISALEAFSVPMLQTTTLDISSIVFVVLIACLAGLASGILPALQLSGSKPGEALGEGLSRGTSSRRTGLLRQCLVATEVALACLLLIGAGLLISSFKTLISVDLGFKSENAVAWRIDGGKSFESDGMFNVQEEAVAYYNSVAQRIKELPGVTAVGLTDTLPLGRNRTWGARAKTDDGQPGPTTGAFPRIVNFGIADAMGIPLLAGRFFNEFDTIDTRPVIVINREMGQRLWDGQDPVGKIAIRGDREHEVIGVVENVRHSSLDAKPSSEMYLPMTQLSGFTAVEMVVRSQMPTALLIRTVRQALREFDETIPIDSFQTLESIVDKSVAPQRMIMNVLAAFSIVALALAAIGLYGVISYTVGQRSKEIGIRIAIGAQQGTVLKMILREGFTVIIIGVTIGLGSAFAFSHYLSSLLFEIAATDPVIFATNAAIVTVIALLATLIPAHRAMKLDPVSALRAE